MTDDEWKKAIENDVPYVPNVKNYQKKKNEATLGRKGGKKLTIKKQK